MMSAINKLRGSFGTLGADAALIFDPFNQQYLSGFPFTDGFLFITKNEAFLVTDFRYTEAAEQKAYSDFSVVAPEDKLSWLKEKISFYGVKTVGLEGNFLPFSVYESYESKLPGVAFCDIADTVETIRQIKTPEEIQKMQRAQDITDAAFSHILTVLTPNMTETEVAAELEYFMRKNGASGLAFDTIAVSGDGSSRPHGVPRHEKLKNGFLTMDFGASFEGYCSDMTRTVVIGKASDEMKNVYTTVLKAQTSVLFMLKAGVDAGEADKVARDIIDGIYPGTFGHGLGHSVGLFIHEAPAMNKRAFGRKLRAGEIVTVEPGIYLPGRFGCRIEDMVLIRDDTIHNFTASKKELIEIG